MVQLCYRIIHPLFWVVNRSECTSPKRNNWQVLGINNLPEHKTMSFSVDPSFWSQASVRISGGAAVAGMDGAGADGADGADSEAATLDLGRMAWNFQRKKKTNGARKTRKTRSPSEASFQYEAQEALKPEQLGCASINSDVNLFKLSQTNLSIICHCCKSQESPWNTKFFQHDLWTRMTSHCKVRV